VKIALIAPPFIPIPPPQYGGTELFVEQLALGLQAAGLQVVVYTNGESTVPVERKWLYPESEWPLKNDVYFSLRDMQHHAWAVQDAARDCDVIHANNITGLTYSKYVTTPFVFTVHHPHEPELKSIYDRYAEVHFACISDFQAKEFALPNVTTIHHGVDPSLYDFQPEKQEYLAFLGRIAPVKGVHLAIEVAHRSGLPLKIAGQIQPLYQRYWEDEIKPKIDGKFIEFIGEVGLREKNALLSKAKALLFPIQWHEPFGLVMVESMACGTPVLALPGGSVNEVVRDGVSGYICRNVEEMVGHALNINISASMVRRYVEAEFSVQKMVSSYVELYRRAVTMRADRERGAA
jgi:glycosyltransferase involved in cell wall biosynthesis